MTTPRHFKFALTIMAVATLYGCASYDVQKGVDRASLDVKDFVKMIFNWHELKKIDKSVRRHLHSYCSIQLSKLRPCN